LNEKIRTAESQFDSVSSFEAEIQLLESKLVENAESQARLEADIRDAKYDDQIRDKIASIRQKEGEKDKIQGELSILNRQADSRAQLTIKRNEMQGRQRQILSS
jgi:DNA repair protein RAD50